MIGVHIFSVVVKAGFGFCPSPEGSLFLLHELRGNYAEMTNCFPE